MKINLVKEWLEAPITVEQHRYISFIEDVLKVNFIGKTFMDAHEFIKKYSESYKTAIELNEGIDLNIEYAQLEDWGMDDTF